jgi:hypothetical protein
MIVGLLYDYDYSTSGVQISIGESDLGWCRELVDAVRAGELPDGLNLD